MGEGNKVVLHQRFQDSSHWSEYGGVHHHDQSSSTISTISNGSSSSSSLDIRDDASSSSSSSSSFSNSTDSLFDLSELMAQLPIKRGISKFYNGKSESFTCLSRVKSIEDLKKKMKKGSKSYQSGLETYKSFTLPKPIISKKTPMMSRRNITSLKPPQFPMQKRT